jgi:hypothetical protein
MFVIQLYTVSVGCYMDFFGFYLLVTLNGVPYLTAPSEEALSCGSAKHTVGVCECLQNHGPLPNNYIHVKGLALLRVASFAFGQQASI